ncbi:MAG TPA: hypothetical protein VI136_22315 [Verrucomicrobiae bacterium]
MARRRTLRRVAPRIFIAHRGGAGAVPDPATGASFTGFVASVPGGKPDLSFAVINGVAQALVPQPNRNWELFDYAVGTLSSGNGGFGWTEGALLTSAYVGRAGLDTFETYPVGAVTGSDLNAGSGWADAPLIAAY